MHPALASSSADTTWCLQPIEDKGHPYSAQPARYVPGVSTRRGETFSSVGSLDSVSTVIAQVFITYGLASRALAWDC